MDKSKIAEKIAKLMALGKSTNPNEAAIALARAQKLMEEYKLTADDVSLSAISEESQDLPSMFRSRWLYTTLCNSVCQAFGLKCFFTFRNDVIRSVTFVGPHERVAGGTYAFTILSRQAAFVKKEFTKEYREKNLPDLIEQSLIDLKLRSTLVKNLKNYPDLLYSYNSSLEDLRASIDLVFLFPDTVYGKVKRKIDYKVQKHSKAYLLGWLRAIHEKVVDFAVSQEELLLIEKFMETNHELTSMSRAKSQRYSRSEMEAFHNGVADGQNGIELFHGINGSSTSPLSLENK